MNTKVLLSWQFSEPVRHIYLMYEKFEGTKGLEEAVNQRTDSTYSGQKLQKYKYESY